MPTEMPLTVWRSRPSCCGPRSGRSALRRRDPDSRSRNTSRTELDCSWCDLPKAPVPWCSNRVDRPFRGSRTGARFRPTFHCDVASATCMARTALGTSWTPLGRMPRGCPCSSISGFGAERIAVLDSRWYKATCPSCLKPIDVLPPESIVAEGHGLAHRCPACRRWLATYVRPVGSTRHPDVRAIETCVAPDDWLQLRRRLTG